MQSAQWRLKALWENRDLSEISKYGYRDWIGDDLAARMSTRREAKTDHI